MKVEEVVHYLKNPETRQKLINTLQNVDENSETIQGLKEVLNSLTASSVKEEEVGGGECVFLQQQQQQQKMMGQTQRVNVQNPDIFHNFLISKISKSDKLNFFAQFLRIFKKLNLVITNEIFENWREIEELILISMQNLNSITISIEKGEFKIPKTFRAFLMQLLQNSNNTLVYMKIPTFFIPPQSTLPKVEEICFYANKEIVLSKDFTTYLGTLYLRFKKLRIVSVENVETRLEHFVNL